MLHFIDNIDMEKNENSSDIYVMYDEYYQRIKNTKVLK